MFKQARWYIVLAMLFFSIQAIAGFNDYKMVYDHKQFLTEGIFQVLATDLNGDHLDEVFVAGKNYIGRELFVYWINFNNQFTPQIKWQSPNLFEERSVIWITSGRFGAMGRALLVMTNAKFYLYQLEEEGLKLIREYSHQLEPLGLAAGDIDGDGLDELIITRIGDITSKMYNCYLQIWKLTDAGWQMSAKTGLLGNIRSVTAGDLNADGKSEVFVEEGLRVDSGNIHTLSYIEGKFIEVAKAVNEIKGAGYSMKLKKFSEGLRLMTASTRGKINFFTWDGQKLVRDPAELSFGSELIDVDAVDLDRDGGLELGVIGYPQRFMVLKR